MLVIPPATKKKEGNLRQQLKKKKHVKLDRQYILSLQRTKAYHS